MPFIKHEVIPYKWNDQKILNSESPHMCHSADGFVSWCCGEFWFESLNTSRPRLQVSSFKTSLLNSDLLQNSSLHTMNQDGKEVYNINSNINKCYWHSPLKVQLWRFSGNRGGINVSTTSFHIIDWYALLYSVGTLDWPICQTARISLCHMCSKWYHRNGIIPERLKHTIPMESYHSNGIIP